MSRTTVLRIGFQAPLVCAALILTACATTPLSDRTEVAPEPTPAEPPPTLEVEPRAIAPAALSPSIEIVAIEDLIRALVQYRDPITTTLQAGLSMANADQANLLTELAKRGYGIQLVDADQGANLLNHIIENVENDNGQAAERHTLQVGRLELVRDYAKVNSITRPTGPLNVAGSRRRIVLDDARFGSSVANDRLVSRIAFSATNDLRPGNTPRISLLQVPFNEESNAPVGTNSSGMEVANVFFGPGNFGSLLDDYNKVEAMSVIFPNDSMRLGNIGRLKIDVFLGDFNEDSDLIRVVGCSNGSTAVAIGNEGLALGRAERVTQELLARGVTREHILDEGCWAPVHFDAKMPRRGVVVELKRRSQG